jgi:hypothetical protein
MALSLQLNVFSYPLKLLCDMLYIKKAILLENLKTVWFLKKKYTQNQV